MRTFPLLALALLVLLTASPAAFATDAPSPTAAGSLLWTTIKLMNSRPSEVLATFGIQPPKPDKQATATPTIQIDAASAIHKLPTGIVQAVPFDLDNCIIVKGTQTAIDEFKSMLKQLDIAPKQAPLHLKFMEITAKEFAELASMKQFEQIKRPYGLLVIDHKTFSDSKWDLYRPPAGAVVCSPVSNLRTNPPGAPAYYITSAVDARGLVVITVRMPDPTHSLSGPDGVDIPQLWETLCTTTLKPGDAMLLICADFAPGKSFLVVIQPTIE